MTASAQSAPISGLLPNTTYHYRMVGEDQSGTTYGPDMTFTTPAEAPTVVTGQASAVTATSATLGGTVDPNYSAITNAYFEWGTTAAYGNTAALPSFNPGDGNVAGAASANITGLTPGQTYHFQLVATNAGGTAYGGDQTFVAASSLPVVTTAAATGVTETGATLNGSIDPGVETITGCYFEWGTDTTYSGGTVPCAS